MLALALLLLAAIAQAGPAVPQPAFQQMYLHWKALTKAVPIGPDSRPGALHSNVLTWLTSSDKLAPRSSPLVVAASSGYQQFQAFLLSRGASGRFATYPGSPSGALEFADFVRTKGSGVDVYIMDIYTQPSQADADAIAAWVSQGGALIVGGHSWSFGGYSPARDANEFPGNRVYKALGLLALPDGAMAGYGYVDTPPSISEVYPESIVSRFEAAIAAKNLGDTKKVGSGMLNLFTQVSPTGTDYFGIRKALCATLRSMVDRMGEPILTQQNQATSMVSKLSSIEQVKKTVLVGAASWLAIQESPLDVRVSRNAEVFPGAPGPSAVPVNYVAVTVNTEYSKGSRRAMFESGFKWCSTGLYAAPGDVITVTVDAQTFPTLNGVLGVQIGSWTDRIWALDNPESTWQRAPDMVNRVTLVNSTTRLANGFGGPVYITVQGDNSLGSATVSISGARRMARYVLGQTTAAEWERMKAYDVPWFELESSRFIITAPKVPALSVVTDPVELLQYYDRVVDAENELAQLTVGPPARPERFVLDPQPGGGYLHSGYPVVAMWIRDAEGGDLASRLVSSNDARNGNWGTYHELGHNHQYGGLTWGAVVEVTCNWFSRYVFQKLQPHMNGGDGWEVYTPKQAAQRKVAIRDWTSQPTKNYDDLTKDYYLMLDMYQLLQENFGWGLFKAIHRIYYDLPSSEAPDSEDAKKQQWIWRTCQQTGLNLAPYYDAWGLQADADTRQRCEQLPTWGANPLLNLDAYFAPGGTGTRPGPLD